jgi:integrase
MGWITRTPAGTFRANWRDDTGRQKSKVFRVRGQAAAFLAETEAALHRGTYVDPHAGRQRFGPYAERWLASRGTGPSATARDASLMRTHVVPRWGDVPLSRIDHLAVQAWVTDIGGRLSPSTTVICFRLFAGVVRSAIRDRIIGADPSDGVRLPEQRRHELDGATITPAALTRRLLPAVPTRYRALVALAGGTGLRWGECVGLRWDCVDLGPDDLSGDLVRVRRVAVEVAGTVTMKPTPKTRAGRRDVPVAPFAAADLRRHRAEFPPGPAGEVFTNSAGGPLRRTLFRSRVWRPALVRAGLLGSVTPSAAGPANSLTPARWSARWTDAAGLEQRAEFATEPEAVAHVARVAAGGMRFHDLRHSYATWLVSRGVPVNDVATALGHERSSTTLDIYTHRSDHRDALIRGAFADEPPTDENDPTDESGPALEGHRPEHQ